MIFIRGCEVSNLQKSERNVAFRKNAFQNFPALHG